MAMLDEFRAWCLKSISPRTTRSYTAMVKIYLRNVDYVRQESVETFLSTKKHPKTYNDYLDALSKLFKFLGLPLNLKRKPVPENRLVIVPSIGEVERFIRAVEKRDVRTYLKLLCLTGIRPERLLNAGWRDFDLEKGWLLIREASESKNYNPQPTLILACRGAKGVEGDLS